MRTTQEPASISDTTAWPPAGNPATGVSGAARRPLSRPRSVLDLAGLALRAYRENWPVFLAATLLLELPLLLLTIFVRVAMDPGPAALDTNWILRTIPYITVETILTLLEAVISFTLLAAITLRIDDWLRGVSPQGAAALVGRVLPRLWTLFGGSALLLITVGTLTVVGVILVSVLTLVILVINADPSQGGLMGALQRGLENPGENLWLRLALLVPVCWAMLFLVVRWSLMVQPVMLEGATAVEALRRSWNLIKGAGWRTLGLLLLCSLPLTLLYNGTLLPDMVGIATPPGGPERGSFLALSNAAVLTLRLLIVPWSLSLLTLYYFDLRLRSETVDDGRWTMDGGRECP